MDSDISKNDSDTSIIDSDLSIIDANITVEPGVPHPYLLPLPTFFEAYHLLCLEIFCLPATTGSQSESITRYWLNWWKPNNLFSGRLFNLQPEFLELKI